MEKSTFAAKIGLAEMLKGGVIMDVMNAEQARVAEDAGACAVMALERVPAIIRRDGGVARASDPTWARPCAASAKARRCCAPRARPAPATSSRPCATCVPCETRSPALLSCAPSS
jgi:hypothetical protein